MGGPYLRTQGYALCTLGLAFFARYRFINDLANLRYPSGGRRVCRTLDICA